tara:strand:+ start:3974 stop:4129 length:156 start_codon:yes stop_codon:yes gene_type:complete
MIQREIAEGLGVVLGFDIFRWYVGVSYETPGPNVRAFVFRLGPAYLHVITS